jgi:hypothetical protein
MPYDGSVYQKAQDPVLGRLTQARARIADRRHWISGRYFEEDSRGYQYCILGALSADPAHDGCMAHDAVGQAAAIWLAGRISGTEMSFLHASRIIYNLNDGYAALEHVSHSVAGFLIMARHRQVNGHKRVLDFLDEAIAGRERELAQADAAIES